ncbi:hypothetical protein BG011_005229 [Mortierella polycephala]|uniref:Uncharacterized protein n=1 Tax=Mortierella polycephala TaxID=41804 RepID=A0A9P6PXY7_9FUNG|nr:hypothetical protein BG011_005229 [Mortierella polycephala]
MAAPGRSLAFAGKGEYSSLPSPSSASSSHHSLQEQEQVEEALRASLSTLLATGPRPRFKQRNRRPKKIYTVDNRSPRSSPLIPASPTHLYYSTTGSPHLRPSNPESILGDLSPHYYGSITPSSRDYDSASSDSETGRQKMTYHRGILSTGQHTCDHYYDIESTTLDSNDPPFSGSTTPLSPPNLRNTSNQSDAVASNALQGPSFLLATRYVSWSVKAQSILDHATKGPSHRPSDGHSSCSSSRSTSPHTSPSTSGTSTPSRTRRKRCPIPEPHQGFFSRALDQRSLASHVNSAGGPGVLTNRNVKYNGERTVQDKDDKYAQDDKENKRWYGQEIGLNLWQTTLGAAALLGTGFGSGMVKKVHNNSVQLHPKELQRDDKENTT